MEFRVGIIVNDRNQLVFGNTVVQGCPPHRGLLGSPVRELIIVETADGATVEELALHDVRTDRL